MIGLQQQWTNKNSPKNYRNDFGITKKNERETKIFSTVNDLREMKHNLRVISFTWNKLLDVVWFLHEVRMNDRFDIMRRKN